MHGRFEPAFDQCPVRLEVELQAVDTISDAKGLIRAGIGLSKMLGAVGQRKSIPMPLEDLFRLSELAEESVPAPGVGTPDFIPANFLDRIALYAGAKRTGYQLSAEADSEYRNPRIYGSADRVDLDLEMRIALIVVGAHRPAKNDQPVITPDLRPELSRSREVDVTNPEPGRPELSIEGTQRFERNVLKNQKLAHCRELNRGSRGYGRRARNNVSLCAFRTSLYQSRKGPDGMADIPQQPDIQMEATDLYREETVTDRRVGSLQKLTPIKSDGSRDETRKDIYVGQTQILTPAGALPLSFEVEADSLETAVARFGDHAKAALEEAMQRLDEMRRESASSIIVPGSGPEGGAPGGNMPLR